MEAADRPGRYRLFCCPDLAGEWTLTAVTMRGDADLARIDCTRPLGSPMELAGGRVVLNTAEPGVVSGTYDDERNPARRGGGDRTDDK
ncbi:MAG: hypothetical protein ACRD1K_15760 [Acidimicrobiales bacterium]